MKLVKSVCIVITLVILMGCGRYKESRTDGEIRQSNFTEGIKETEFKTTPQTFDVYSKSAPVIVIINDTLNLDQLGISRDDLLGNYIYLYVHPLDVAYWYRQNPAIAAEKWTAQANLSLVWESFAHGSEGYLSKRKVNNGLGFQIIAVLIKQSLSKTLPEMVVNLEDLTKLEGVHVISDIRTAIVKR